MTTKRRALSKKTRFEIFKRDAFTCQYCGATPPQAILHVDHINPVSKGGGNEASNLITACLACNLGKSATPLESVPMSLEKHASDVAEREAQLRGYESVLRAKRERIEDQAWDVAEVFMEQFNADTIRKDWLRSIRHFVDVMGVDSSIRAMDIACRARRNERQCFMYFCGICWRCIHEGRVP